MYFSPHPPRRMTAGGRKILRFRGAVAAMRAAVGSANSRGNFARQPQRLTVRKTYCGAQRTTLPGQDAQGTTLRGEARSRRRRAAKVRAGGMARAVRACR